MNTFNFIDTKFLALNGDLSNTVTGGTAMLKNEFYRADKKYIIKAKLPTKEVGFLKIELLGDQLLISAAVQTISDTGIVFSQPFGAQAFVIPRYVDQEKIRAYEQNDFLVVELPIALNHPGKFKQRNIDINLDDDV